MELVVVELDASTELDATKYAEVADAELVGDVAYILQLLYTYIANFYS
jgi:hypothetical protein